MKFDGHLIASQHTIKQSYRSVLTDKQTDNTIARGGGQIIALCALADPRGCHGVPCVKDVP